MQEHGYDLTAKLSSTSIVYDFVTPDWCFNILTPFSIFSLDMLLPQHWC